MQWQRIDWYETGFFFLGGGVKDLNGTNILGIGNNYTNTYSIHVLRNYNETDAKVP